MVIGVGLLRLVLLMLLVVVVVVVLLILLVWGEKRPVGSVVDG